MGSIEPSIEVCQLSRRFEVETVIHAELFSANARGLGEHLQRVAIMTLCDSALLAPGRQRHKIWCWDVTFLPAPMQGRWFYLYLILEPDP